MNDRRYLLFETTEFAYSEQKVAYRGQHYQRTVADLTVQTRGWNVDRPYGLWLGVSSHPSEERYVEVELDGASGRVRLDPQVRPELVWTRVATVSLRANFLQMRVSTPEATLRVFTALSSATTWLWRYPRQCAPSPICTRSSAIPADSAN